MKRRSISFLAVFVLVLISLVPTPAAANSTPTRRPAEVGGLVVPTRTPDVRIERETLSIDLTNAPNAAKVRATYDLANAAGRPTSLDVAFVAPRGNDLSVSLDGRGLAVGEAPTTGLPGEWTNATSALDPATGAEYDLGAENGWGEARAWTFALALPAGAMGRLVAEYEVPLGYDRSRHERIVRGFAYALGPARNWAGVGRLEVEVLAPSGWVVAASPALAAVTSDGGSGGVSRYVGGFDGVPAETLRVGLMSRPTPLDRIAPLISLGLPVLAAIPLGPLAALFCARLKTRWLALLAGLIGGGGLTFFGGLFLNWYLFGLLVPLADELSEGTLVVYAAVLSTIALGPLVGGVIGAARAYVGWGRRVRRLAAEGTALAGSAGGA